MELRWRPAVPADADAVCALVNSAYRGESSKRGWTTEAELLGGQRTDRQALLELIADPAVRLELALGPDGALLGCLQLRAEGAGACYVGMLTVDPERQGAGIGRALLERAESLAAQRGCSRLRMTVIDRREELLAYYERRGYRRSGATEPFPEGDPRFGLPKLPGLRFVELVKPLSPGA